MARPTERLRGQVAVVTGGTRGLGLRVAIALAQAGARIALCGRDMARAEALYAQLSDIPGVEALVLECDVRTLPSVERFAAQVLARFERLDLWVNNARTVVPDAPLADLSPEQWRAATETTLMGTFHGTRVALQAMVLQGTGTILNLLGAEGAGSVAGAGVVRLTEQVASTYTDSGISIVALAPGPDPEESGEWVVELASGEARRRSGQLLTAGSSLPRLRGLWRR